MNKEIRSIDLKEVAQKATRNCQEGELCFDLYPPVKIRNRETGKIFHAISVEMAGNKINYLKTREDFEWYPTRIFQIWDHLANDHKKTP